MIDFYEILETSVTPNEEHKFLDNLLLPSKDGKIVTAQESEILDYKAEFPHSMSGDYCAGIIRLVIAFYNTFGGFIVFGVHDKTRETYQNTKFVNIERLNQKVAEVCSSRISLKHISTNRLGVDIILVPKRPNNLSPVFLKKSLGKFTAPMVWYRQDQEVLKIEGKEAHFLFSNRDPNYEKFDRTEVSNYFPPSRATIDTFVGRIHYLITLHEWIQKKRERVMHLYGRGGSGKTKIAYEFADILRENSFANCLGTKDVVDKVLFLTAKETELRSYDGTIQSISAGADFSNPRELMEAVLLESELASDIDDFSKFSENHLIEMLFDAFQKETFFIVVDDIDTITTKGNDSGISLLYEAATASPKCSKILVTQRNTPREWLRNSIKIEGFQDLEDVTEFVFECCEKFDALRPSTKEIELIYTTSEGIPLIIETIVGLSKGFNGWKTTVDYYNKVRGDEARKYMHNREYEALRDPRSKILLLALNFFNKPCSMSDLEFVLRCTSEQLEPAISEASSMFINRIPDTDGTVKFVLTETANAFMAKVGQLHPRYEETKARHKLRISGKYPQPNAVVSRLIGDMKKALSLKKPDLARQIVTENHGPGIEENVHFMEMKAQVLGQITPPQIAEARLLFNDCIECNHLSVFAARAWANLEQAQGGNRKIKNVICPFVLNDKSKKDFHSEFYSRRAAATVKIASDLQYTSPEEAYGLFEESLFDNCLSIKTNQNPKYTTSIKGNTKGTAWNLVNLSLSMRYPGYSLFVKTMNKLGKTFPEFDFSIIGGPLLSFVRTLHDSSQDIGPSSAERGFLSNLKARHKEGTIRFSNAKFESDFISMLSDV